MNEIINSNDIVYSQSNNFIESRFSNFTVLELKIIELLAAQTNSADKASIAKKHNKFITIRSLDLARLINSNGKNMYAVAKNLANQLVSKKAEFKYIDNNGNIAYKVSNFFNNITYQNNTFEFEINYAVLIYFINLKQYFTQINFKYISGLNSTYAIRLYKLLKQYQTAKKRVITVEEIRQILSLTNKLKQFSDIRKKVIETAIKQINKSTDLNITYSENKVGRITKSITFNINKN